MSWRETGDIIKHLLYFQARVGLYKKGKLLKELIFDAQGSDNKNWFSASKLTHSPYSDTTKKSSDYNFFSIEGDKQLNRYFIINRSYGQCGKDVGWMVIGGHSCEWEKRDGKHPILYSTQDTSTNWNNKGNYSTIITFFLKKLRQQRKEPFKR